MIGPSQFMFATGIENSYPTIKGKDGRIKRIDEMEAAGHYRFWREDFALALNIGVTHLRYGPPLHKTWLGPGHYDWDFADETFNRLQEIGLCPITDLCHFGVPDWIENFQNPDLPRYFEEYARDFAKRYPWVNLYTPVNEIYIAALFSGLYGMWNERMTTDRGFVTALKHLCQANTRAMRAILKVNPSAVFIQSESAEYYHPHCPSEIPEAHLYNARRFLALDFTYGHNVNSVMYEYLMDNGMTRDEYHWFHDHHVKTFCIMGTDYYSSNEHLILRDKKVVASGEIFGYYVITKQYYDRYKLPIMHTETNVLDDKAAPGWLNKEWHNLYRLRKDGLPIMGFTWYSLTDQVDWDSGLVGDKGVVNPCGLFDLNRNIRQVGLDYKLLIESWKGILPTGSAGLKLTHQT